MALKVIKSWTLLFVEGEARQNSWQPNFTGQLIFSHNKGKKQKMILARTFLMPFRARVPLRSAIRAAILRKRRRMKDLRRSILRLRSSPICGKTAMTVPNLGQKSEKKPMKSPQLWTSKFWQQFVRKTFELREGLQFFFLHIMTQKIQPTLLRTLPPTFNL